MLDRCKDELCFNFVWQYIQTRPVKFKNYITIEETDIVSEFNSKQSNFLKTVCSERLILSAIIDELRLG